jgi:hypothetical protein
VERPSQLAEYPGRRPAGHRALLFVGALLALRENDDRERRPRRRLEPEVSAMLLERRYGPQVGRRRTGSHGTELTQPAGVPLVRTRPCNVRDMRLYGVLTRSYKASCYRSGHRRAECGFGTRLTARVSAVRAVVTFAFHRSIPGGAEGRFQFALNYADGSPRTPALRTPRSGRSTSIE